MKWLKEVFNIKNYSLKILYIFGVFCGVFGTVLIKYLGISKLLTVNEIIFFRALLGFLIILPFCYKEIFIINFRNKFNKKSLFFFFILQIFSICSTYSWHYAIQLIPVNNAILISYLGPIFTSLLAYLFFKESIKFNKIILLFLNIILISLIYKFQKDNFKIAYIFIMFDVFLFYGMIAICSKKLKEFSTNFLILSRFFFLIPFSLLFLKKLSTPTIKNFTLITILTITATIQRFLFTYTYQKSGISSFQHFKYFSVVFSIILSYIFLSEGQNIKTIISVFFLLSVNYLYEKYSK